MTLDVPDPTLCNATTLRKASRKLTQLYDEVMAPSGLRSTQYAILSEIARRPGNPPTMRDLAEELVLDRSALGHNLRPLEREGLIELINSKEDKRRRLVQLSPVGKARHAQARELWRKAQKGFERYYGVEKAEALRAELLGLARDEDITIK